MSQSSFTGNGTGAIDFDGIRVDERGPGCINALITQTIIDANGGDVEVSLFRAKVENNFDEGLDFDEAGDGDIELELRNVKALNTANEGIKVDELGEDRIKASLKKVSATNNTKYGIKMEQWFIEDEEISVEELGSLKTRKVTLSDNGKGDDIKLNNIVIK